VFTFSCKSSPASQRKRFVRKWFVVLIVKAKINLFQLFSVDHG